MSRTKKRIVQKLLCLCLVISLLTGTTAFAKRNNYEWQDTSIVYFDESGLAEWDQSYIRCIQRAMSTWNSVTVNGDPLITLSLTRESNNKIRMVNNIAEYLGLTIFDPYYVDAPAHTNINSVIIQLNSRWPLADGAVSGCYDVQSIIQHELGHALGIAHCHEKEDSPCNPNCKNNTMHHQTLINSTEQRYLKIYDTSSKLYIYENME